MTSVLRIISRCGLMACQSLPVWLPFSPHLLHLSPKTTCSPSATGATRPIPPASKKSGACRQFVSAESRCWPAIILERNSQICYHNPMKSRMVRRTRWQPLASGQVWRMKHAHLSVQAVGKWLVHYKLGKPNAKRVSTSCNGIKAIEKYLKTHKAVLVEGRKQEKDIVRSLTAW